VDNRLRRSGILRKKKDFERVFLKGRKVSTGPITLHFSPNPESVGHVAFVTSGKFPSNVARNRVRRRLRELYRTHRDVFPSGIDIVLRGARPVANIPFAALREQVLKLVEKANAANVKCQVTE
jgi:ribonuclease P protein component